MSDKDSEAKLGAYSDGNKTESVFETGNFSAKYVTKDKSSDIGDVDTPKALQSNDKVSEPISFQKIDPPNEERGYGSIRKESLLSASISRSLANQPKFGSSLIMSSNSITDNNRTAKSQLGGDELTEIVQRHLPSFSNNKGNAQGFTQTHTSEDQENSIDEVDDGEEQNGETTDAIEPAGTNYTTMKTQGGFITRDIENWVQDRKEASVKRVASSGSLDIESRRSRASTKVSNDQMGHEQTSKDLVMPGGFRRNFLVNNTEHPKSSKNKNQVTKNFFEFLALYGHFAGQDLREEGEDSDLDTETETETEYEDDDDFESINEDEEDEEDVNFQNSNSYGSTNNRMLTAMRSIDGFSGNRASFNSMQGALYGNLRSQLKHNRLKKLELKNRSKEKSKKGKASTMKAFLLLLKAFLGTGVVFLPKAFSNGGLLFSNVTIIIFSLISYYCFVILINTTRKCGVSGYGDAGYKIYGNGVRTLVLLSLVLSQMGFASSYVVFVGTNLKELYNLIWSADYTVGFFIILQLGIFMPLSLTRKISKLGFTALIADAFIFLGLIYIYSESIWHLIENGVSHKVSNFNSDSWTLFIGTAVFAYEGIGLLIPVQESMKEPEKFDFLLLLVMIIVTLVFTSLATVSYLAFGDDVQTVVLMNFPRNAVTLTVQLCYAVAILLSTPLQIFPAIKIVEHYLFHKNRKTWTERIRRNSEALSLLSNGNENPVLDTLNVPQNEGQSAGVMSSNSSQISANPNLINQEGILSGKSDSFIKTLKNFLRVFIIFFMTAVAYLGSDHLDKFVSLVGSFTCIPLIYIYPPLLYWGCFQDELTLTSKCASGAIFIMGCLLMAYTSYDTIANW